MRAQLTVLTIVSLPLSVSFAASAHAETQVSDAEAASARDPASAGPAGDPNIDRGFILPTAMTQPAGSLTYSNYELLLHGLTYGISDHLQISLTVLPPLLRVLPFVGIGALKARISPRARFHVAFQASAGFGYVNDSSDDDNDDTTAFDVGAGVYASLCLRDDCASLLNASVNYQYIATTPGSTQNLIYGGSVVVRVTDHSKLMGEITSLAQKSDTGHLDNAPGFLASYGVRFNGASFAADVGFAKPVYTSSNDNDDFVLGLPFVSFSYRWI